MHVFIALFTPHTHCFVHTPLGRDIIILRLHSTVTIIISSVQFKVQLSTYKKWHRFLPTTSFNTKKQR